MNWRSRTSARPGSEARRDHVANSASEGQKRREITRRQFGGYGGGGKVRRRAGQTHQQGEKKQGQARGPITEGKLKGQITAYAVTKIRDLVGCVGAG